MLPINGNRTAVLLLSVRAQIFLQALLFFLFPEIYLIRAAHNHARPRLFTGPCQIPGSFHVHPHGKLRFPLTGAHIGNGSAVKKHIRMEILHRFPRALLPCKIQFLMRRRPYFIFFSVIRKQAASEETARSCQHDPHACLLIKALYASISSFFARIFSTAAQAGQSQ